MSLRGFLVLLLALPTAAQGKGLPSPPASVAEVFASSHQRLLIMELEAAVAEAQAAEGIISPEAAAEIRRTAAADTITAEAFDEEYDRVRHRMVAVLNVWRRSLSPEAAAALHKGVTTVDVYDTVMILQLKQTIALLRVEMLALEKALMEMAINHRATPMVGRTLGQHALPITFARAFAKCSIQIEIFDLQIHDFRDSATRRIKGFEYGPIPKIKAVPGPWRLQELIHCFG